MTSSDDDEIVPRFVTNYYFVDEKEIPISFSVLPVRSGAAEKPAAASRQVFLHGRAADGGLQKVYKQVTSWNLRIRDDQPMVSVFSKDGRWIELRKPRPSYERRFRTTMIAVHSICFLKRKPESSEKSLWDHLYKVFSSFEVRPSMDDLRDQVSLIKLFAERYQTLGNCKLLSVFLKEKLGKGSSFYLEVAETNSVAKKPFNAYGNMVDEGTKAADDFEEEEGLFDPMCAICDNGGEILCCEGRCLRSFHATKDAGFEANCESLGYSRDQVEAMNSFLCKNCQYRRHQCFVCGKLGSSDKAAGAEVFRCASATCGHYYHPKCVAELLFEENTKATKFQEKIAAGESFTCPIHQCIICKHREDKSIHELQFAICRRCPTSYHRRCLPRTIAFEDLGSGGIQRAWDGLLRDRILIYCLKHDINGKLGTPLRNHIMFPEIPENKNKGKNISNKRKVSYDLPTKRLPVEPSEKAVKLSGAEEISSIGKGGRTCTKQAHHLTDKAKTFLKESTHSDSRKVSSKEKAKHAVPVVPPVPAVKKFRSSFPQIDIETQKRMKSLMDEVSSSLTIEGITERCIRPSTHAYCARHIDKNVTLGKVEGSVEAIRTALQKMEDGVSVDDAKAVCEPNILSQIIKWRRTLKVYLGPFLHGMRYTSFGRHFTKVDKLNEIADKLQCYVKSGDTIVDFCCGANDFSRLMKERLDAAGKQCSFKNYDVIQSKDDSNFEKRDWMTVDPKELPDGSQLIMGLNPPFGIRASLANKFIDKALTFRPKLLILIVPKETERLDEKDPPYDLIWEDCEKLSGKSFYLPGSVDTEDKQIEQWNLKPPPLYLWSRRDWTRKHMEIAVRHHHTQDSRTSRSDYRSALQGMKTNNLNVTQNKTKKKKKKKKNNQNEFATSYDWSSLNRLGYGCNLDMAGPERSGDFESSTGPTTAVRCTYESLTGPLTSDCLPDFMGFAPGPLSQFSHKDSSGGWLDD